MKKFEGKEVADFFTAAFGIKIEDITPAQLWWITKVSKTVRRCARSNVAFNNYMNGVFSPHAKFRAVPKENYKGEPYDGLQIEVKGKVEEDDGDE